MFLSEGAVEGRFASIDPAGGAVEVFDTLPDPVFTNASFDDVLLHEDRVYVAGGDTNLLVYDALTMTLVDSITGFVPRKLALYDDLLLMTTYDAPYFRAYNADDLSLAWSLDTTKVPDEADDLFMKGDTAFVAVSGLNGFGDNGRVGNSLVVINLPVQDTIATVTVGSNPTQLIPSGDNLYVKSLFGAFPDAFIELVGVNTQTLNVVSRDSLFDSNFYGPVTGDGLLIYYQDTTPQLAAFDPQSSTSSNGLQGDFYAASYIDELGAFVLSQGGFGADTSRVLVWSPVGIGFGEVDTFLLESTNGAFNSVRTLRYIPSPLFSIDNLDGAQNGNGQYCTDSALTLELTAPDWLEDINQLFLGSGNSFTSDDEFDLPTDLDPGSYSIESSWTYLGMVLSDVISFDLVDCSTSRPAALGDLFTAYPNPTTGSLTLEFGQTQQAQIELLDLQGRALLQQSLNGQRLMLDFSDLSSGVYLLHIHTGDQTSVRRIIKR